MHKIERAMVNVNNTPIPHKSPASSHGYLLDHTGWLLSYGLMRCVCSQFAPFCWIISADAPPVVAIDIGKFGTACSWKSNWDPVPAVLNLDTQQPNEKVVRKSPNSLLVHRDNVSVMSLGDTAEKSYACGSCPVGAKLFRRFGRQRMRVESDPTSESAVKCSRNRSEMELSKIMFYLLMHARDVSKRMNVTPCFLVLLTLSIISPDTRVRESRAR